MTFDWPWALLALAAGPIVLGFRESANPTDRATPIRLS